MKKYLFLFLMVISACDFVPKGFLNNNTTIPSYIKKLHLIDTLPAATNYLEGEYMQAAINKFLTISSLSDTVFLQGFNYQNYSGAFSNNPLPDGESLINQKLKIYVLESKMLSLDMSEYSPFPPSYIIEDTNNINDAELLKHQQAMEAWDNRPPNYIKSNAVVIYNPTKATISLEMQDLTAIMIQEAKDESGKWQPIEYWTFSWCGNSYGDVEILPKNMAIFKIPKYNGDFETDIRIKFKNHNQISYSNVFRGKINKTQFSLDSSIKESNYYKTLKHKVFLKQTH